MDALFGIFEAWNALAALFAGTLCAGIAVAIGVYLVRVRLSYRAHPAQIVGLRSDAGKQMFWPVVAFEEDGVRREVNANSGSGIVLENLPGTKLTVFANPATPETVLLARDWWLLWLVVMFLVGCGTPFIISGYQDLRFDMRTLMVALVAVGVLAYLARPFVTPLFDGSGRGIAQVRGAVRARLGVGNDVVPMSEAAIAAVVAKQRRTARIAAPLIGLVGVAILGAGVCWNQNDTAFIASALVAEGRVLHNDIDTDGETPMYHAVVEFTDAAGNVVTHRDTTGHSDPSFEPGDKVTMLYARDDSSRAMIDRGRWNLLWPLLVMAAGALLIAAGIRTNALARRASVLALHRFQPRR